jgi:single-strand DNA-binding protein
MNYNHAQYAGNMVRDPEIKYLANGTALCNFAVAANHQYVSNGEKKKECYFANCTAFGKTAEVIAKYFTKGKLIFVEGRMKTEKWEKDGVKKSRDILMVDKVSFVSKKEEGGSGGKHSQQEPPADDDSVPF